MSDRRARDRGELERRQGERRRDRLAGALEQLEADRRRHERRQVQAIAIDNARTAHWINRFTDARNGRS